MTCLLPLFCVIKILFIYAKLSYSNSQQILNVSSQIHEKTFSLMMVIVKTKCTH